jgi:DNA-binding transcriptional LysR family regulator
MYRDLLGHLPVILSVARNRGFASAAAELGISPSVVSHAVRTVEDRIGEPLFARTTRSVSLTEAGNRFLNGIRPGVEDIEKAFESVAAERGEVTGVLRLNASRVAQEIAVTPILAALAWKHPRLTVEVHTNDGFVDIVGEGFDAGIRLGESIQRDMIAVRLTRPFKAITVASPAYLAVKGEPRSIADLKDHNCIGFRLVASGAVYDWELAQNTKIVPVKTSGTVRVTDATFARELALAGCGIAYIFEPLVRREISEGRLRWILHGAAIEEDGLFLYYASRASLAPKLRAFIDAAKAAVPSRFPDTARRPASFVVCRRF